MISSLDQIDHGNENEILKTGQRIVKVLLVLFGVLTDRCRGPDTTIQFANRQFCQRPTQRHGLLWIGRKSGATLASDSKTT